MFKPTEIHNFSFGLLRGVREWEGKLVDGPKPCLNTILTHYLICEQFCLDSSECFSGALDLHRAALVVFREKTVVLGYNNCFLGSFTSICAYVTYVKRSSIKNVTRTSTVNLYSVVFGWGQAGLRILGLEKLNFTTLTSSSPQGTFGRFHELKSLFQNPYNKQGIFFFVCLKWHFWNEFQQDSFVSFGKTKATSEERILSSHS